MTVAALSQQFNDAAGIPVDDRPTISGDVIRTVGDVRVHCINGVDHLSASTVVKMSPYSSPPDMSPAMLNWLAERGKAVHTLCQLASDGVLDEYEYDLRLQGYVDAWRAFSEAERFTAHEWEALRVDEETHTFGYCDVVGSYGPTTIPVTLELKTADDIWTSHRLQLCCYSQSFRAVVALHKDGTYDCAPGEAGDRAEYVFLAGAAHRAIAEREDMQRRRAERERAKRRAYRQRAA